MGCVPALMVAIQAAAGPAAATTAIATRRAAELTVLLQRCHAPPLLMAHGACH
jgi:hypothetical protein